MRRATVLLTAMVAAIVLASGIGLSQTTPASPTYTIRDLGTLPGGAFSFATDINATGQIVGSSVEDSVELGSDYHGFLYSGGQMRDLGTLPGATQSEAIDINDSTQIVGSSGEHAFLYSGGQMKDLGTLPGGNFSHAWSINNSGQIVGDADISPGVDHHAFLYSGGQMKDLGTLGGRASQAYDINDSGQVVGESYTSSEAIHAFLYSNGQMRDLGHLGGNFSVAHGINGLGQVVGGSYTSTQREHAFLYSNGQMRDLGTLPSGSISTAYDINDSGEIVGLARTPSGADHAFIYSGGQMYDLNNLIPAGSGWVLEHATAINTSGQIVGVGRLNGQTRAFLATPDTSLIDTTPPKVMSTVPKANADEVAPTANVRATFSEDMRRSTINVTTFKLFKKGTTTQISAQVSYNADTDRAKLDPTNLLKEGVAYKVVVTTWAKDVAENRLDQDSFTTGLQQKVWYFEIDD
jgi:probable HAF family extracellular repeat protein